MKNSVRIELAQHIIDKINDKYLTKENKDDWHFSCFNEGYYIIGYFQCDNWLNNHEINTFEAIRICQQYELDNFGKFNTYDNSEQTVNMLVYIWGEELLSEYYDVKSPKKLKKKLSELIDNN